MESNGLWHTVFPYQEIHLNPFGRAILRDRQTKASQGAALHTHLKNFLIFMSTWHAGGQAGESATV